MADSSTTTAPIQNLIAGDRCSRCHLRSSIKDVSVASNLWRLLTTLVRAVLIGPRALPELDVRFLHDRSAYSGSDCGRLLGSMPATQRYKGRLCRIKTPDIADHYGGCLDRSPGPSRARCQITQRPLGRFWT